MNKKKIIKSIYIPISNVSNKYIEIVQKSMKMNGIEIAGIKTQKSLKKLWDIDIVNLNWFEARVNYKNPIKAAVAYFMNILLLYLFKICRIKIIVTLHNLITHDVYNKKISEKFLVKICSMADALVVMNHYSFTRLKELGDIDFCNKAYLIPHPTYSGAYCDGIKVNLDDDYFNLLFVGQVRPYKNIELILKVAKHFQNKKIRFYICGYADNTDYRHEIEKKSANSNVILNLKFLDDRELIGWIEASDALLLPYSNKSSLNSGTSILAFSCATTVIGTLTGTLREFPNDLIYSYEYNSERDHYMKICEAIDNAYMDYKKNRIDYENKGIKLKKLVDTDCSIESIGKKYRELYDELINK